MEVSSIAGGGMGMELIQVMLKTWLTPSGFLFCAYHAPLNNEGFMTCPTVTLR